MVSAITALPVLVAKLTNNPTLKAQALIVGYGLFKGYSLNNIKWLCKQFRLETGNGSSNVFKTYHNAFGMGCVQQRQHQQTGCYVAPNGENIGIYASIGDSVHCRFMWDAYWGFDTDKRSTGYAEAVSTKYHESATYMAAVNAVGVSNWGSTLALTLATVPIELFLIKKLWKF